MGALGRSFFAFLHASGVLGRFFAFLGAFLVALGLSGASLGRFWVDFSSIFGRFATIVFAFWEVSRERGYFSQPRKNLGKTTVFQ